MPLFTYTAKRADNKIIKGQLVAGSEDGLADLLRQQSLTLTSSQVFVKKNGRFDKYLSFFNTVPVEQKIFFTQNLGVMLRGGFSISRAMATLALQTNHKLFKQVLYSLQSDLESGSNFSLALKKYPNVFSELFINMIAAGELSGKLDEVLKHLTIQMKKDHQLIGKVKGALTYPIVVVVAMIGAAVAMITFVIPKLLVIFTENNAELPLPTRILIGISNLFQYHGLLMGVILIAAIILFVFTIKSKKGGWYFDRLVLWLPIVGPIIRKINLARFTRNLGSMLSTDIPIIQAFQIIAKTLTSAHYRRSIDEASQALKTGAPISKVLQRYPSLYPPIVQQMISVGEESGTLDEVSGELATFLEEEVEQTMANLSTIIEPVLLLVLGVAVAGMAVAILLPMYSLSNQIN